MDDISGKRERLSALDGGKGIQYILNSAYEILGNPLAMYGLPEYNLLACAENIVTDDHFFNELLTEGAFSAETMKYCKDNSWFDAVANEDMVTYIYRGELKYDRILGKLYNGDNILIAGLVVLASDKPFEDGDMELVRAVCKAITWELGKSEYYRNYGNAFREALIRELIEGGIEDKGYYSPFVANIYRGLRTNLYLALADIMQNNYGHTRLSYFRDLFMETQKEFKYSIYGKYIVIIISTDEPSLNIRHELMRLYKIFVENNITVGISGVFDNLYRLGDYYAEALVSLEYGIKTGIQGIYLFDEL